MADTCQEENMWGRRRAEAWGEAEEEEEGKGWRGGEGRKGGIRMLLNFEAFSA